MSTKNWLIFKEIAGNPAVQALFDSAVDDITSGTPPPLNQDYPVGFMVAGQKLLGTAVLEYRLRQESVADLAYPGLRDFVAHLRALLGWNEIGHTLHRWVHAWLRDPYFVNQGHNWSAHWVRKSDAPAADLSDSVYRFACDIALGDLKYGPSYARVSAEEIFDWVTQLGSDLPAQLLKQGTGELPPALARWKGEEASATANDALAVVRITQRAASEAAYGQVLDYLVQLLSTTDFPRSYAIEYRGPTKVYLPIPGLPRKGVHQLFAAAAAYPGLHERIAAYAHAAMREHHWYQNLEDAHCALPGSFAVFALAWADTRFAPLVLQYLHTVDGEHQSLQGRFVEAYVDAHGLDATSLAYLMACAGNIQHLRHRKTYPARMDNAASLQALLALRQQHGGDAPSPVAALRAQMTAQSTVEAAFAEVRRTLWGDAVCQDQGRRLIARAPEALRPLYAQVFAPAAGRLPG
ncbi:DUF6138 family protein [Comamonas aquatica]|jgi:hypothetical protein|uniref:DUF6138 family protein n=1 Tax=Comamonas aquatica TaxID=225991 RepID=A0AA42L7A1_9BURK|nr:DUF6138 family protein [Comamonas aquatica]MDH0363934.1 DUF6138 family protein [Comamonas aquatica]MDH1429399.1 DUF6138 family protein [Comamonas aquatica]MDH1606944.1 DUF6138 family protein [Comamonas aquatica]MDH1618708.1 DUF6138 family protein [Comamonas aquatica]MDH2006751.1 DUF6138 family protein [Comamonas aquatica]